MTSVEHLSAKDFAKIAWARLYVRLGWPGMLGLVMAAGALGSGLWLHLQDVPQKGLVAPSVQVERAVRTPQEAERANAVTPPELPLAAQQVDILKRVKALVLSSGLSWPKADYKLVRLSDENLAHLEVHTTLKGAYPKLRQLITSLLDKEPALGVQELSLQRPNADTQEVEAKIRFVVYLADDWPPAQGKATP